MANIIYLRDRAEAPSPPDHPAFQRIIKVLPVAIALKGPKAVAQTCRDQASVLSRVMREVDRGHPQSQDVINLMADEDLTPSEVEAFVAWLRLRAMELEALAQ